MRALWPSERPSAFSVAWNIACVRGALGILSAEHSVHQKSDDAGEDHRSHSSCRSEPQTEHLGVH
jgi:hypothetical protein